MQFFGESLAPLLAARRSQTRRHDAIHPLRAVVSGSRRLISQFRTISRSSAKRLSKRSRGSPWRKVRTFTVGCCCKF
jgi:hypothetical protein